MLNEALLNYSCKPQVFVEAIGSISLNISSQNIEKIKSFCYNKADYVILSIDQSVRDIDEVLNRFSILYEKKVDLVLVSQFISMKIWSDKKDTVYKHERVINNEEIIWINNGKVPDAIMEGIEKKITLPENVMIL